jgi:hypothetical protein
MLSVGLKSQIKQYYTVDNLTIIHKQKIVAVNPASSSLTQKINKNNYFKIPRPSSIAN